MRDDYDKFKTQNAEILAIAPHSLERTRKYWTSHSLLFPCLADQERTVFKLYDVRSRLLSLGQRPGLYIIDTDGALRFAHVGSQQWHIPSNERVLARLDEMARPADNK
ncbi:MAG: redoxin domain-containing protein [Chloroflexi bacterium]|nr:redoxin domain-containing protein [Chloroflexota bacterium]